MAATAPPALERIPDAAPARARRLGRAPEVAAVAGPAALAAGLAAAGLGARSLGFDEAASVTIAAQHGHALARAIAHDGGNMSGYYLVLHAVIALFGHGLVAVRLPSVICTAATVALVAMLGLRLFDRRVAAFAGLISAVSLPLIFWGQSARGYAPMLAFVTASWLSLVSLLERRRGSGIAYALTTVLAVYSSFVAVLSVAAQAAAVLPSRRTQRTFVLGLGACALGCVPLVVLALDRGSGQLFWVARPSLHSTWQMLETLASAGLPPSFGRTAVAVPLVVLTAAAIGLSLRPRRLGSRLPLPSWRPGTGLLLAWLIVPLALALVESLAGQSIFVPRNLLVCLPPVALLLALALSNRRVPRPVAWAALALLLALRAVPLIQSYGVSPEDWKGATSYVLAGTQARDCVAFYPSDARMPFAYYLGSRAAPRPVLPAARFGPLRPYVEDYATLTATATATASGTATGTAGAGATAGCARLWLVSSHEGQTAGPSASRRHYAQFVSLRGALERAYPRHRTASFGDAAVIRVELLSGP